MAQVVGSQLKLNNGKLITPKTGGWYDGQQYWNGTLSQSGYINSQSNQQGAGQAVSQEVNKQTSIAAGKAPDANQNYINGLNAVTAAAPTSAPTAAPKVAPLATPTTPTGTPSAGTGTDFVAPTPIDLPGLYQTLTKSAGVSTIEQALADKATAYAEAQKKINDNPFLSEATRVGRVAKLSADYNNQIKNEQDLLALRKADVETQLNLQSKQFDITSQAARDAMERFNTLLKMGSLDGASGEDIANIVRSTGLSSSAIQSAINNKRMGDLTTEVKAFDDGTNDGFVVYTYDKLGNIVNSQKQVTGTSTSKIKASGDPAVNSFINSIMQQTNQGTDISSLW